MSSFQRVLCAEFHLGALLHVYLCFCVRRLSPEAAPVRHHKVKEETVKTRVSSLYSLQFAADVKSFILLFFLETVSTSDWSQKQ